jgi:hypothetical protein
LGRLLGSQRLAEDTQGDTRPQSGSGQFRHPDTLREKGLENNGKLSYFAARRLLRLLG